MCIRDRVRCGKVKFKAILFDLDGTLLDTSGLIVDSFKHAFQKMCIRDRPK